MSDRSYPAAPAGPFPAPPLAFEDRAGRRVEVAAADYTDREREAVVAMYRAFDPEDRAQGIPPVGEAAIREWLGEVFRPAAPNVVAWHDEEAAGHAMLVPQDGEYELAIFVLQAYQEAGIGTRLVRGLLGHGEREGVERVWLTVERWNAPAIGLYEKIGFETTEAASFELEMSLRLDPERDHDGREG